ncbi:hypothetical protein J7K74_00650 [Candidatus Woesearchaeota archaeon]|nr:hypothetical protein [Candidatus Woesearchaeota archaeon]
MGKLVDIIDKKYEPGDEIDLLELSTMIFEAYSRATDTHPDIEFVEKLLEYGIIYTKEGKIIYNGKKEGCWL